MKIRQLLPASLAAIIALGASTASAQVTDTTAGRSTVTTTTVATQTVVTTRIVPSDSAVVATLIAANQKEIAEAGIAINQAQSDRVKDFARQLQHDHSKAVEDLQNYLQKNGGGMSSGMAHDTMKMDTAIQGNDTRSQSDSTYANQQTKNQPVTMAAPDSAQGGFQSKTGRDFDKAWIERVVDQHQRAIDNLRENVIPTIQDTSLKTLVQGLLPVMGNHLRDAQALQSQM